MAQHIFSGAGAPATTPTGIGHHYIDTTSNDSYISVGTSSAADWQLTAGIASVAWGDITGTLADQTDLNSALSGKQATGNYVTALTGDVTATGPGSVAATVAQVGGQTAAAVASATVDVGNATSSNLSNTIVKRDGSGNFAAGTITASLNGNANNVTGIVAIANGGTGQSNAVAALNNLLPDQTGNAGKALVTDASNASWQTVASAPSGSNSRVIQKDGSGNAASIESLVVNSYDGVGYNATLAIEENGSGQTLNSINLNLNPTEAITDFWQVNFTSVNVDQASGGFDFGIGAQAVTLQSYNLNHNGTSDVGGLNIIRSNFDIGNGTDPIDVNGFSYFYGFGTVDANVTLSGPIQGYGFQPSIDAGASIGVNEYITAFYDSTQVGCSSSSYISFSSTPIIANIQNNKSYQAININPTINAFTGNASAYGMNISGTYEGPQSWQGIYMNPTVNDSTATYAAGLNITMDNVTVYAGVQGSVTVQDLTYTWNTPGEDANSYSVEYVDTATAGSESASLIGFVITVAIESGVSTATQVKAAIDAVPSFVSALTVTISGTASNPQVTDGPDSFTGGEWAGNKYAAQFDGNVSIDGSLSFTGALSIGEISAFYSEALTDGGGTPGSGHSLITAPTVAASATVANADYLGVNTAALINIGASATVTTAFIGVAALGLPAVLTMGASSTLDRVSGAVFALSLDAGGSTGTVDQVSLCRALAIPNGVTTVNRFYGYEVGLPFGPVGTDAWGIYVTPDIDNWLKGSLRIGGTTISDDQTAAGNKLHVDGNSFLDGALESTGNIGFFGTTPVAQQASSGAQTATGTWTATEQAMLQEAYDALRAYGLLS